VYKGEEMEEFEVYLAGRIANLSYDEAVAGRDEMIKKLNEAGIKCRTPLRGKQHLKDGSKINGQMLEKCGLSIQEIIQRDLSDLREVDALVVLTGDDPSWGTAGEFYFCTWIANKPTVVVAKNYIGGWMEYYATQLVPDFDQAVEVLKRWKKYWNHKGSGIYDMR
jgi:hypothetical protein